MLFSSIGWAKNHQGIQLTAAGKVLQAQYKKKLYKLKTDILAAFPEINKSQKEAYFKAIEAESKAKAKLAAANKNKGELSKAQTLVGHAKGKWIGGADRGIATAKDMLKKASNSAQRSAAQKELEKWQKNRQEGVKALKERQALLDKAKKDEAHFTKLFKAAELELAKAKKSVGAVLIGLQVNDLLKSAKLDPKLLQVAIMNEATPAGLAVFAQQDQKNKKLIDSLLGNTALMKQMLIADGAKDGQYGQALLIYSAILKKSSKARQGELQRLALAISLEHAVPVSQRNPLAQTSAAKTVDPVKRYLHYEQAYLNNELDPAFKFLNVWDYRMVVDGNEPDEALAWGREMLRTYRPDHIATKDYRWRYVAAVRTEIRYGSEDNKHDKPELHFFQNILMNGGVCGRRAFFGRFILRAFGIPTTARPQRGHAALVHWTPKGWVICLGANWGGGWTKTLYRSDWDFLATSKARVNKDSFLQVKRAQWIGDVYGEKRVYGLNSDKPAFWNSLSLNLQRKFNENSNTVTLAAVGTDIGEANESRIKEKVRKASVSAADRKISIASNGVITIPATACSKPTNSTGKIKFMNSFQEGMQLHYEQNGRAQDFEYTFISPAAGKYLLCAQVATPTWKQQLFVSANGSKQSIDLELPHTLGLWEKTKSVLINLTKGKNTLHFSRGKEVTTDGRRHKGITIKEFTLTPLKK